MSDDFVSASAAAAREASRTSSGQFGTQTHAEADIDLDAPGPYGHVGAEAARAIKQFEAVGTGGPDEQLGDDEVNTRTQLVRTATTVNTIDPIGVAVSTSPPSPGSAPAPQHLSPAAPRRRSSCSALTNPNGPAS